MKNFLMKLLHGKYAKKVQFTFANGLWSSIPCPHGHMVGGLKANVGNAYCRCICNNFIHMKVTRKERYVVCVSEEEGNA